MELFSWLLTPLIKYWQFLSIKSIIEILCISSAFYYFSLWLRRDRQKNLLFSFYAYCVAIILAHACNVTLIEQILFMVAPVTLMLFILVHQETLQKNFILTQNITPAVADTDWLGMLMRIFLIALSKNKSVVCVIEKHDSLKTVLTAPLSFNAQIQKDLMDILLSSDSFDAQKMIWVNHHGQLLAINATWNSLVDEAWIDSSIHELEEWKQDALLLANKTDALIFKIYPETRTVDLIAQKRLLEHLPINDAVATIKKYLYGTEQAGTVIAHHDFLKGSHEAINKKSIRNQSIS